MLCRRLFGRLGRRLRLRLRCGRCVRIVQLHASGRYRISRVRLGRLLRLGRCRLRRG